MTVEIPRLICQTTGSDASVFMNMLLDLSTVSLVLCVNVGLQCLAFLADCHSSFDLEKVSF
jgi:hypothetical protein